MYHESNSLHNEHSWYPQINKTLILNDSPHIYTCMAALLFKLFYGFSDWHINVKLKHTFSSPDSKSSTQLFHYTCVKIYVHIICTWLFSYKY